jgi:hypothetical protein
MADGFLTGVSRQPLDLVSGAQSFMRSAVESRLAEIEANKIEVSENYKNSLKAMSLSTVEGLSENLRRKYQGRIEEYRKDVMNKFLSSGGKLSMQQEKEIQDGYVDIQRKMAGDVSILNEIQKVQDMALSNPTMYNIEALSTDLGHVQTALDKGEYTGRPSVLLMKHQVPVSEGDFIAKHYGNEMKALEDFVTGDFTGNIFKTTELTGLDPNTYELTRRASDLRDRILENPWMKSKYTNPDGSINPEAYARQKQVAEDNITRIVEDMKSYSPRAGSGKDKELTYLTPTTVDVNGEDVSVYNVPAGIPQTKMTITVGGKLKNANTGRMEEVKGNTLDDFIVKGVSPETREVFVQVEGGGVLERDGQPLLARETEIGSLEGRSDSDKMQDGQTPNQIKENAFSILVGQSSKPSERDWTRVVDAKVTENNDGSYTLSGTLERHGTKALGVGLGGVRKEEDLSKEGENLKKSEQVSITYQPITGGKEPKSYALPMDEYKDVLQRIVGKFGLVYDGKRYTWDDVFNRPELFQKAGGKSSGRKLTDAQEAQVSKLLEKNPGWTREEIINELGL